MKMTRKREREGKSVKMKKKEQKGDQRKLNKRLKEKKYVWKI